MEMHQDVSNPDPQEALINRLKTMSNLGNVVLRVPLPHGRNEETTEDSIHVTLPLLAVPLLGQEIVAVGVKVVVQTHTTMAVDNLATMLLLLAATLHLGHNKLLLTLLLPVLDMLVTLHLVTLVAIPLNRLWVLHRALLLLQD